MTATLSQVHVSSLQINGPMDHGWCHHYTCQKRVSTFYSIVAMNQSYEIHLTGTSPKRMRYHFLDITDDQEVVLGKLEYTADQFVDRFV